MLDVFGAHGIGHIIYYTALVATIMILYTGGNTSFNGFPFLANYVATDKYLPRQLTKRGHRLAFSNGIIVLGIVALTLIIVFDASVNALVALYAIGVFTGFTLAGRGHGGAPPARADRQVALRGLRERALGDGHLDRRPDLLDRQVQRGRLDHRRRRTVHVLGAYCD